jgi:chromosome segregation ATPase
MPADDKKDIEAAKSASSLIASLASSVPKQSKAIEDELKERKKPLAEIQKRINEFGKDAQQYEADLEKARKALAAVQKCKAPEAGDVAKKLQSALKEAERVVAGIKPSAALFEKVWDKCSAAQQQLRTRLEGVIADAQKAMKTLGTQQRDVKTHTEALRKEVEAATSAPPSSSSSAGSLSAALKKPLETLTQAAKDHNAELAVAEGVDGAITATVKDENDAHDADVVKLVAETKSVRSQLQKLVGAGKTLVKEAVEQIRSAKAVLTAHA